ncbi:MAG: SDR family oxidoreductase [Pirellulales bacterium]
MPFVRFACRLALVAVWAIGAGVSLGSASFAAPPSFVNDISPYVWNGLMIDLSNRTAVITGGSSGIGRATAVLLSRCGARVFVGDSAPQEENQATFAELGITEVACDVRREADVSALVDQAVVATDRLDIAVHSAGIVLVRQIPEVMEEEWDACFDTNLKGAFLLAKHAIVPMRASGGGSIVHISSNAGLLPRAHDPVYSTSKAAVIAFTRSLALSHGIDKIRVNAVCPGPVSETGIVNADLDAAADRGAAEQGLITASPIARAIGRMITPDEVAQAVLYLVSDAAVLVTGTMIAIDGGKSLGVPPEPPAAE